MAGFLVRRRHDAHELQAHDVELAKRAASALLAADEGIRIASEEVGFAEAELGAGSTDTSTDTETAAAVIAAVRRHLTDAFRLNRLNHDAMPGTPDEVRARYVLILRLCEWAELVLEQLTSTLADRVARARQAPVDIGEIRADVAGLPRADVDADPHALLIRLREARSALDAATTAARERATTPMHPTRPLPPANLLQHAIDDADRKLDAARDAVADHPGWVGAEARTRLAEAERIRIDLGHCLGSSEATATTMHESHRTRAMTMARSVASLAGEALLLARRDLDASRRQGAWV